jgi:hypothetical protein
VRVPRFVDEALQRESAFEWTRGCSCAEVAAGYEHGHGHHRGRQGGDRLRTGSVAGFGRADSSAPHCEVGVFRMKLKRYGEPRWNRTINPQIKSLLLCQLS